VRAVSVTGRLKVALTRSPKVYDMARRPYALGRFLARRPHDHDYAAFRLFPQADRPFLDVGANAGMSAFSFRIYQRRAPIVSIEPNPFHERDLRFAGRIVRDHSYRLWAAGASEDELTLFVPVFRGVPLTTEASLDRESVVQSPTLRARLGAAMDTDAFRVEERQVPVKPLDVLGCDPAFIKLDVQGYDFPALQGLQATIERSWPVLVIESAGEESHAFLVERGYEAQTFDPGAGRLEAARWPATNVFYVRA
jgi:FkbM family methyltransferase